MAPKAGNVLSFLRHLNLKQVQKDAFFGAHALFPATPTCQFQMRGHSRKPATVNSGAWSCPPLRTSRRCGGGKNDITWMKVLQALWRESTGIISTEPFLKPRHDACLPACWRWSGAHPPTYRPQSAPCVAQKMWTTTLASPKASRPSHWLPISWGFLQVDHYFLSLLFWPPVLDAEGLFSRGHGSWFHHVGAPRPRWARLPPRWLKQEATLAALSTQKLQGTRWSGQAAAGHTSAPTHSKINRTSGITESDGVHFVKCEVCQGNALRLQLRKGTGSYTSFKKN